MIFSKVDAVSVRKRHTSGHTYQVFELPSVEFPVWYENRDGLHSNNSAFQNRVQNSWDVESSTRGINLGLEQYAGGLVVANASLYSDSFGALSRQLENASMKPFWELMRMNWQRGYFFLCPEHVDYDAIDKFQHNHPYAIVSQGSSGSDQPVIDRLFWILSKINADVLRSLIASDRAGDVINALFRRSLGDHLNDKTHRPVVSIGELDQGVQVSIDAVNSGKLPPKVSIAVAFADGLISYPTLPEYVGFNRPLDREVVLDVRVQCDKQAEINVITSQGKATVMTLMPNTYRIIVPVQETQSIEAMDGHRVNTNRVDVHFVAFDGVHYSSPATISFYAPPSEIVMPKKNAICVAADNEFVLRVNGKELSRGDNWMDCKETPVQWDQGENKIEVEVKNLGGPGGAIIEVFSESQLQPQWTAKHSEKELAIRRIKYGDGEWGKRVANTTGLTDWMWCDEVPGDATIVFSASVKIGEPAPTPEPAPSNIEARVAALESFISKLKEAVK